MVQINPDVPKHLQTPNWLAASGLHKSGPRKASFVLKMIENVAGKE